MIKSVLIVYSSLCFLSLILYLPKIFGFRYGFKKPVHKKAQSNRRIGVIIPARNESKIIDDLFQSIEAQDYDKSSFEVFVVVKEQTDPTIEMAKSHGYNCIVIENQTCKGEALDGVFKSFSEDKIRSFEAFVIVDADGAMTPNYLTELNNALEYDADIYVTKKVAKNFLEDKNSRSIYSNCTALTWPMLDDLGNSYKTQKKMPLNLCGQGLMVRARVIEQIGGWPYRSMTEDYELKYDGCMIKGFSSVYYPYAVLYTEEAIGRKENYIRRERWLTGYSQCNKKYKKLITNNVKKNKRMDRGEFDFFFGILPYILFIVSTLLTTVSGIGLAIYYAIIGSILWQEALLSLVFVPIITLYLLLVEYTLIALFVARDTFKMISKRECIMITLYNPIFLIEYIFAFLSGNYKIRKKKLVWKETERNVESKKK